MNRDQAQKCIAIARKAMSENNYEKVGRGALTTQAEKFFAKSINLHPTDEAKGLLVQCRVLKGTSSNQNGNQNHRAQAAESRPAKKDQEKAEEEEAPKYTPEQERLCKDVLKRGKTYYQILGVSENAKEDEMKRAYKKMAMKVHPDRNRAPSATEAFKKVSTAYQILCDGDARRKYDASGHDQNFTQPQQQQQHYHHHFAAQDPFEFFGNLFGDAAFFGGNGHFREYYEDQNGNIYERRRPAPRRQQQRRTPEQERQAKAVNMCLHYLPFIMIMLVSLLSMLSSLAEPDPLYQLRRSSTFNRQMQTSGLNIEYFVSKDFEERIGNQYNKNRMELEIETNLYNELRQECSQLRRYRKKILRNQYYFTKQVRGGISQDLQEVEQKVEVKCGMKDQFYDSFVRRGIRVMS